MIILFNALLLIFTTLCTGIDVIVDWDAMIRVSKTLTTLQVVTNPILDRHFTSPNGTVFPNPIHDQCWESLAALEADLVRFVPWFPYPHKSVAELDAPVAGKTTSWNFTFIMPQLSDFMNAVYGKGHTTVINFSTQPCWLFKNKDCSYPANPDQSFFKYVRGNRKDLLDQTGKDLAAYYGRLLSYLIKGEMTDENGHIITGGPKYDITKGGHVWEVFNEAEHGYNQNQYTFDYDNVIQAIRSSADPEHGLQFMGIGGASPNWIPYFLNKSNHAMKEAVPIQYISLHHYSSCKKRTDPNTYSDGFFGGADGFIQKMVGWMEQRDQLSPQTKFDLDELGVIMPDDNNPNFGINASLPDIYWPAAGAMYAYMFGKFAIMGVEVLGHSQLAGSPKIPEWGIPLPQYPSVSLLDWRTGYGNSRYWVLRLLIQHFAMGDKIFTTTTGSLGPPTNPFCGLATTEAGSLSEYGSTTLRCVDKNSTITSFDFVDWGTPSGSCGSLHHGTCTSDKALPWAIKLCVNRSTCTLAPYPALGDPCVGVVKSLIVQAKCSGPNGGYAINSTNEKDVFALGFEKGVSKKGNRTEVASSPGTKKILLVNKVNKRNTINIASNNANNNVLKGTAYIVDPLVKPSPRGSPNGIRTETFLGGSITLEPFATAVLVL